MVELVIEMGTGTDGPVVEQEKEQGEVQDLSYTQLRSRLPNEISNEIVMLLANSQTSIIRILQIYKQLKTFKLSINNTT